jgi:hypothetical protein
MTQGFHKNRAGMALGFSVMEKKRRAARFNHAALVAPNALVLVGEDVRREYKTSFRHYN